MNEKNKLEIFEHVKNLLKPYTKVLKVVNNTEKMYTLYGNKEYKVFSERTKKYTIKKDAYFCGIMIQKNHVGFYFMPAYAQKDFMKKYSKELQKKLKGKSCFYLLKIEDVNEELKIMIQDGFQVFKKMDFI